MSLKTWQENGWLKAHRTSVEEIGNLFAIVDRDLTDAACRDISSDARFVSAYNAALKLCTILLNSEGYRPDRGQSHHYRVIEAVPEILGAEAKKDAKYLDTCRVKRNAAEYDYVNAASDSEADDLLTFAEELQKRVVDWLKEKHPGLLQKPKK